MPHACTNCDRSFPDGSTEMLSGCPACGGNRFQFIPDGAEEAQPTPEPEPDDIIAPDPEPAAVSALAEDRAQADARSSVVEQEELPQANGPSVENGSTTAPAADEPSTSEVRPRDIGELRKDLEDRFESIKIVDRGEYELNLMELYERPECIIELGENGRYAIHVPETLRDADA